MSVHKKWMGDPMSCVTFNDADARQAVLLEEDVRRARSRQPRVEVRVALARDIGIAPGTIENLRRNRLASLRTHVRDRIYGWMLRGLQQDYARLEHELYLALQSGKSAGSIDVLGAKAALASARKALTGGV